MTKQIRLNAFTMNTVGHMAQGLWKHPADRSTEYKDIDSWIDLARLLERGKFDGMFLADELGAHDVYGASEATAVQHGVHLPLNDPLLLVSAMAAATKDLCFTMTANVTYEHPYLLARRMSTLDHLTRGRWGWNIVTGIQDSAARAMGQDRQLEHDRRYDMADEFMDVMYKLLEESWDDDAVVLDKERDMFADPSKVHRVSHEGAFFKVNAIHLCEPSPQRTPVLFQAGASARGLSFAAKHAECVLLGSAGGPAAAKAATERIRSHARESGRRPEDVLVFVSIMVVVAPTHSEAQTKYEEYLEQWSSDGALAHLAAVTGVDFARFDPDEPISIGGTQRLQSFTQSMRDAGPEWTVRRISAGRTLGVQNNPIIGSPVEVADELSKWVSEADIDGFNLHRVVTPGSYEDFIELVIPELQNRGLFKTEYEDGTMREKLFGRAYLPDEHYGRRGRLVDRLTG